MVADYLARSYRALMLDTKAEYSRLIDALTRVLDQEPGNVTARTNRAVAFWEIGDIDHALRDLSDAIIGGTDPVPLMNRGDILKQLGRPSEALVDYSAAIKMEPDNSYYRRSRAHILHRLGRYREAIADYDVAIQIEPNVQRTLSDREKALAQAQLDEGSHYY
jgi:tetratricopeptide (TPR) repeat protein